MRRVLCISPHFPPDSSAGAHRVRIVAPYLRDAGWDPEVLTVDAESYAGERDLRLEALVPSHVTVTRAAAVSVNGARRIGLGDLGLRAWRGLRDAARRRLASEHFDVVYITTYPTYPALIGPGLARRFGIGFVIDLQDPWVGEWGRSVGGGPGGSADLRSRLSRLGAQWIERRVLPQADGVTTVSPVLLTELTTRYPELATRPHAALPIGIDPADFAALDRTSIENPIFDPADGLVHVCYVGAVLPLGISIVRACLQGLAAFLKTRPDLSSRVRVHFVGSSNQRAGDPAPVVLPLAREIGLQDIVTEHPLRVGYLDSLRVLRDASVILLLGSTEQQYSPSKAYPALLARRPIVAAYREDGPAADLLRQVGRAPSLRFVGVPSDDDGSLAARFQQTFSDTLGDLRYHADDINESVLAGWLAPSLARELGLLFDQVAAHTAHRRQQ